MLVLSVFALEGDGESLVCGDGADAGKVLYFAAHRGDVRVGSAGVVVKTGDHFRFGYLGGAGDVSAVRNAPS